MTLKSAGESVERRGFLDGDQAEAFYDPILNAQIARLLEEVGEFARSCRSEQGPSQSELADILIVGAAIAYHLGWDMDQAVHAKCLADEMERGYRHNGNGDGGGAMATVPERGIRPHWYDENGKALFDGRG